MGDFVYNIDALNELLDRMAPNPRLGVNLATAKALTTSEVLAGSVVAVGKFTRLSMVVDYTKGTETAFDIIVKYQPIAGGALVQNGSWNEGAVGIMTFTAEKFRMTATGKTYIDLDVKGKSAVSVYLQGTGTCSGTATITYSLI